jgi:hypothetical protein
MTKNKFNFEKVGTPIARVVGGKQNGKIVYLYSPLPNEEPEELLDPFESIHIEDGLLQKIHNPYTEREVLYFTGRSGSGKSYQIGKYLEQYKKSRKNNKIYLFSPVNEDDALDKYITKRVTLDSSIYEQPFEIRDFENCCLIFDDTDVITDKKIKTAVYNLMNQSLETGRHHNITVCIVNHLASDRNTTKRILNECHYFCFFPANINANLKYTLSNYVGIEKEDLAHIRKTESRHCYIYKNFPLFILTERDIWLVKPRD